jgi:hypothetical protein
MSDTQKKKIEIERLVGRLFSDTMADETEQAEALESIAQLCQENAEVLREQMRNQE